MGILFLSFSPWIAFHLRYSLFRLFSETTILEEFFALNTIRI
ncbi:hypothetical protein LEP1GSC101_2257 [Leptospira borgpetersenii str. UI 09149]|nr:hypothetical protein LEP1GSC101_2257 [Leptospira borgpetersenii str. UI 09149]EMN58491.1 hypothetical protein LEP1GSC090_0440 [Leptospira borgpetersenii serovar Javanica str. MK146]